MPEFKSKADINVSCLTHFELDNSFKAARWKSALSNSDFFVTISEFTYEIALSHGIDRNKIKLIKYGVDPKYKPTFKILVTGASGRRKGLDFLKSLQKLLSDQQNIEWRSASENWLDLKVLSSSAEDLRLSYAWADVLVVPSELEGAHTGTLEAIFSGLKVLTRPVGWANSELKGYVETYSDEVSMAKRIVQLKNEKCDFAIKVNQDLIQDGFSYDSWRTEHDKLFKYLMSNKYN